MKIIKQKFKKTHISLIDKDDKEFITDVDSYLIGLMGGAKIRVDNNWHAFIIITGNVGDGKSSMASLLSAIWQQIQGMQLTLDNVVWNTIPFIEKTDRSDNVGTVIWWDEAIQGATGKKMAMTKEGSNLLDALVTKRFKKHLYVLLLDDVSRYSKDVIKMCNCWIHIESFGLERGYFRAYSKKSKVSYLYDQFKKHNRTWDSKYVNDCEPDHLGTFNDYTGKFIDELEYNREKLKETNSTNLVEKEKLLMAENKELKKQLDSRLKKQDTINEYVRLWKVNGKVTLTEVAKNKGFSFQYASKVMKEYFKEIGAE